jgi:hypothetical protein
MTKTSYDKEEYVANLESVRLVKEAQVTEAAFELAI